ncbi:ABC transporter ATP-binding protein, partial [Salinisphaera sp. Q1T1-3]|uniref:ABC transporter ATP-binding protein n=1 Tax=Salinisphaera sp. Q1T1-3 TaxID=2321229 RepID=UPI000EE27AEF
NNLGKRYPGADSLAVTDFNLTTEDGEFIVLVGPSGCGKTTTMRMIAGLEEHTEGTIEIGGRDVTGVAPKDRDIAMVFQSYALYPHMSVRDNMAFSLKLKKYDKADIRKRVEDAADVLGITDLLDRKPRALSGGQRQRVALGRAIVRQPQVFLMDEPLSNLDAKLRVDMRAEIIKLHRKLGVTTFYVTHDQTEAMTMGQRIAVMKDGIVQQIDTPNNLYQQPANVFVGGFIGTPSMNVLAAERRDDRASGPGFTLGLDATRRAAAGDRERLTIGIRPEHLHLAGADDAVQQLSGEVEVVEPLGALTLIQVRVGQTRVTAQIEPHQSVAMGESVTLGCAADKLYLFDTNDEKALVGIDIAA